jgi:hypothetical protein
MVEIKAFNAVCANVANEDEVLTLGVGDDAHDPQHFFIIGRFDEDELAIDECIGFQSDDTAYELAAAIEAVTLSVDTLTIRLNEAAAQQAGYREYCAKISAVQNSGELQAASQGSAYALILIHPVAHRDAFRLDHADVVIAGVWQMGHQPRKFRGVFDISGGDHPHRLAV